MFFKNIIEKCKSNRRGYHLFKECDKFNRDWIYLMSCLDICNKKSETYCLRNLIKTESDYNIIKCKIQIPFGLLKDDLLKLKPYIEESLECKFECDNIVKNNCVCAEFKLID